MNDEIDTAKLEVISAAPTARGCHDFNMIRRVNRAPPSGTAYTAPSPAPAAHANRISRSRSESLLIHPVATLLRARANWRGATSRPSDAPEPTTSTCKAASKVKG